MSKEGMVKQVVTHIYYKIIGNTNMDNKVPPDILQFFRTDDKKVTIVLRGTSCVNTDSGGLVVRLRTSFAN